MKKIVFIIPLLTGCVLNVAPTEAGGSCMEPNTNYSESFVEVSGTCGPRGTSSIGIGADGNIPLASGVSCQVSQNNGCESVHQCSWSSNSCLVAVDSHLTFSSDGSTLSGNETIQIQCPDGSGCTSQYQVTGHRQ